MEPSVLGRPPEGVVGPVHGNVQNVHQLDHDAADVLLSPHSDYPLNLHIVALYSKQLFKIDINLCKYEMYNYLAQSCTPRKRKKKYSQISFIIVMIIPGL
jgi:hypothetical protein